MAHDIVLYVLKLEGDRYYVGQSANVHQRIDAHSAAKGAVWTQTHPPVAVVECKRTRTLDQKAAEVKENLLTLEVMKRHGWRNVRGGWFCNVDELLTEKALKAHGVLHMLESADTELSPRMNSSDNPLAFPTPSALPLKKVTISSVGSCDTTTRVGYYEILLEYNGRHKYLRRKLTDTTANRCIIQGLIDGAMALKEPCEVTLVAATALGFGNLPKLKGPNVDLLHELIAALKERSCPFTFELAEGQGDQLREQIRQGADQ